MRTNRLFFLTRAAMMLLVTVLTSVTALAQTPGWVLITEKPTVDGGQTSNWGTSENYDKLVDGDLTTKYGLSSADPWVEFHYQNAFVPVGYILWTASDSGDGGRNPMSWKIMAKNEGDADWTVLDEVDNTDNTQLVKESNSSTEYTINNTKAYQYYRFEATRRWNVYEDQFQLAELQFYTVTYGTIATVPAVDDGEETENGSDEDYDKLVDGNLNTKYCIGAADPWIEFHYDNAITPNGYILWTANDTEGKRNPSWWTIKAKLNADDPWTTLATVDNASGDMLPKENNASARFPLYNNKPYKYFRFEAKKSYIGMFQLAELQFFTASPYNLNDGAITRLGASYLYDNGNAIPINYRVMAIDGSILVKGQDYSEEIRNSAGQTVTSVNAVGDYTLTVTGTDPYSGTLTKNFSVIAWDLTEECKISVVGNGQKDANDPNIFVMQMGQFDPDETGSFQLMLDKAVNYPVSVEVALHSVEQYGVGYMTVTPSETNQEDLFAENPLVTFAPGETTKTISFKLQLVDNRPTVGLKPIYFELLLPSRATLDTKLVEMVYEFNVEPGPDDVAFDETGREIMPNYSIKLATQDSYGFFYLAYGGYNKVFSRITDATRLKLLMPQIDYNGQPEEFPTISSYEESEVEFVPRWQSNTKAVDYICLHRFSDSNCLGEWTGTAHYVGEDYSLVSRFHSAGPFYNPKAAELSLPTTVTYADIAGTEAESSWFSLGHVTPYINNVHTAQTSYVAGQQMDVTFTLDNWKFYYVTYKEPMLKNLFVTFDQGKTRQPIINATMTNGVVTASVKAPEVVGRACMEIGVLVNDMGHFGFRQEAYYPSGAYTYVTITEGTPVFVPILQMTIGGVPDVIHFQDVDAECQYTAYAAITPATATCQGGKWTSSDPEVLTVDEQTGAITFRRVNPENSMVYLYNKAGKATLSFVSDEYDYRRSLGENPVIANFTLSKEVTMIPRLPECLSFYIADQRQDVTEDTHDVVVDFMIDSEESWNLSTEGTVTMTIEAKDGTTRTLTYNAANLQTRRDDNPNSYEKNTRLHVYVPLTLTDHEYSLIERQGGTYQLVWALKTSADLTMVNSVTGLTHNVPVYRYINFCHPDVVLDAIGKWASPFYRDIVKGQTDYLVAHAYNLPKEYFSLGWAIKCDENWDGHSDYTYYSLDVTRVENWSTADGTPQPDWLQLIDRGDGYYDAKITVPVESNNFNGVRVPLLLLTWASNNPGPYSSGSSEISNYINYDVLKEEDLHYFVSHAYNESGYIAQEINKGEEPMLDDAPAIDAFNSYLATYQHELGNELFDEIVKLRKYNLVTISTENHHNYWKARATDIKITGGPLGEDTLRWEGVSWQLVYFPLIDATYKIILHSRTFNTDRTFYYTTHGLPGAEHIYGYDDLNGYLNFVYATKNGETKTVPGSTEWRSIKWFYEPDDVTCFDAYYGDGTHTKNSGLRHGFFDTYTMPTPTYVVFDYHGMHEYAMIFDDIFNNRIVNSSTEFDDDGTVHLTLHNLLGEPVTTAHVNYVAVDADGNPTGDNGRVNASDDGKVVVPFNDVVNDNETGSLYMEVVADGYEPRFYKYNIKDQTYRHPFVSLPSNEVDLVMETNEQTTTQFCRADLMEIIEADADTTALTFNIVDLTAHNLMDRIGYKEQGPLGGTKTIYGIKSDGGVYHYEKRWEGEKFAQLGVTLRKNNVTDYSQMRLTGFGNAKDITPTHCKEITTANYTGFEHDYVDATFDVVGFVPNEKMAIPILKVDDIDLGQLPKLHNEEIDMDSIARNTKIEIRTNPDFDIHQVDDQAAAHDCDMEDTGQLFDGIDFNFPEVMGFQFQVKKMGNYFQVRGVYSKNFLPGGDEADMVDAFTDQMKDYANQFDRVFKDCMNSCTGNKDMSDPDFDFMADKDPLFGSNDAFIGIRAFLSGIAYLGPDGEFMVNFHEGGIKLEMSAEYSHNINLVIASFGAKLSGELSTTLKLINRKADTGDVYNFGLDVMVETEVRAEIVAWAKAGLDLYIAAASVGVRGGASVGYKSCISYPLIDNPTHKKVYSGHQIDLRSAMLVYADARFLFWRWHKEWWLYKYKKTWCFPDNKDNPYSDNFELGPSIFKSRAMASRGWKKMKPRRVVGAGDMLMGNVTGIASPRIFNHGSSLVYNKLNSPGDYNDDRLMLFDLSSKQDADINESATGAAFNFDVDERGDKGIVTFEQYNSGDLTSEDVEDIDDSIDGQNSMSRNVGVQASLWDGSNWQTTKLSPDGVANLSPRAAVQPDGHAAVVWLSGTPKATNNTDESKRRQYIDGQYLLSRYDGTSWSEPIKLANLRQSFSISDHQIVMSGDSILIYMEHRDEIDSPENPFIDCITVTPKNDVNLNCSLERGRNPQIARVGDVNLVAYLTERADSVQDIRLRTVNMQNTDTLTTNGYAYLGKCGMMNFKLAATENAKNFDDVALIWSQSKVKANENDASTSSTQVNENETEIESWLCAGRIGKDGNNLFVSYPDKIVKIPEEFEASSFDGYIDNDSLHVVYTLSDINDITAVIQNGVKFTNGFSVKEFTVTAANATSTTDIPFRLNVLNTGYAPMTSVTAHIGATNVEFSGMNVLPGQTVELTGNFGINTETYNGEEQVSITAQFADVNSSLKRRQLSPMRRTYLEHGAKATRAASDPNTTVTETLTAQVKATDLSCTVLSSRIRDTKNTVIAKITNCSPLPLLPGQTVTAGLYASLTDDEPISGTTLETIPVSDLYANGTPLTKVIKMQAENLTEDQQAFIKVIVKDSQASVVDVKPENNHVPVMLYAKDGNVITLLGDANSDGLVNIADVTAVINCINGIVSSKFNNKSADVNRDGKINIADVTGIINIINQ